MDSVKINFTDKQGNNLRDKLAGGRTLPELKGRVQILEKRLDLQDQSAHLVCDTSNLIIYGGRSWLLNRAFNQDIGQVNSYTDSSSNISGVPASRLGMAGKWINLFGVGTGGSVSGQPLNPATVSGYDLGLTTPASVTGTAGSYVTGAGGSTYKLIDNSYPLFLSDQDVVSANFSSGVNFTDPQSGLSQNVNSYLIALIRVTLGANDANGTSPPVESGGPYSDLNEAMLFCSPSTIPGYYTGLTDTQLGNAIVPFAKTTFSSVRKSSSREIVFQWYIYF